VWKDMRYRTALLLSGFLIGALFGLEALGLRFAISWASRGIPMPEYVSWVIAFLSDSAALERLPRRAARNLFPILN
jgi:hypothetical protein